MAEAEKLQAELDATQDDESDRYLQERIDEIETRLEEIEAAQTEFSAEQKSRAGVIFTISHCGKPSYHYGLIERGAKARLKKVDTVASCNGVLRINTYFCV
jgi:hypothetical protein